MPVLTRALTVGSASVQLATQTFERGSISIYNNSNNTIFVDNNNSVNSTTGFPILANTAIVLAHEYGDDPETEYWAIATTGSNDIRILEGWAVSLVKEVEKLIELLKPKV